MLDHVGQRMGNYTLERLSGQGSFAHVYLGTHIHLGTVAAIKVLEAHLTGENIKQFREEARIIARLKHPHIVRILDFDVQDGTPFLVMEYAPNGTLRQYHPKGEQLSLKRIVPYVQQLTSALQYAHDQRLIHRDVKPENMLLDATKVLLSDFGIAIVSPGSRYEQSLSTPYGQAQRIAGTVAYMAPEQLHGKPCLASDQYALGVVIYEWLCGERPFQGTPAEIASQHILASPPRLCPKVPTLSPKVEEVVLTALAKEPHSRFASVREFGEAFEQASQMDQTTRLNVPPSAPAQKPHVSRPQQQAIQSALQAGPSDRPSLAGGIIATPVPSRPSRVRFSRRTVLIGLVATGLALGGIVWFVRSRPMPEGPSTPATRTTKSPLPLGTTVTIYKGHKEKNTVYAVAWSPGGQRIASASQDQTVQVWDAETGKNPFPYLGHHASVDAVAWSPDGQRIGSGSSDARVWSVSNGSLVYSPKLLNGVEGVAWSHKGNALAAASDDGHVYVWNANAGKDIFTYSGHQAKVLAVAWSPDGQRVASASHDATVQVWNPFEGGIARVFLGHTLGVNTVAWSPDGQSIASGSSDGTIIVWDADSGRILLKNELHAKYVVEGLAWSPDGQSIVSAGTDNTAQVWDPKTGTPSFVYSKQSSTVWSVAWSPDSQQVASGCMDGTVHVWQAR